MRHSVHQRGSGVPPVSRPRDRPPATSADAIADVALRLFAEAGFEATTVDDVARAAGVARRTLLTHYPGKDAIVWDGRQQGTDALVQALAQVPPGVPWRAALVVTFPAALRCSADDLDRLRRRLRLIGATPALQAHLAVEQEAGVGPVAAFIAAREGGSPGDLAPIVTARAVLAAVSAALVWWSGSAEPDPRAVLRRALGGLLLPDRPTGG